MEPIDNTKQINLLFVIAISDNYSDAETISSPISYFIYHIGFEGKIIRSREIKFRRGKNSHHQLAIILLLLQPVEDLHEKELEDLIHYWLSALNNDRRLWLLHCNWKMSFNQADIGLWWVYQPLNNILMSLGSQIAN